MDPQSPPKRVTRSRAAKAGDPSASRTTKIVTAAAKAKAARGAAAVSSTTTSTATKRKTRSDDVDDEQNNGNGNKQVQLPAVAIKTTRATRGRAKKPAEESVPEPESAPAPATRPRGRPKKTVEPAKEEPAKPTRASRTKKTQQENDTKAAPEPVKKTTRTRAVSSAAKPVTKATVKKSVKFEEPEKENIAPTAATKGKAISTSQDACTGLRAKPVRRAASATTARAARTKRSGSTSEQGESRPSPLSPKKVTQMTANQCDSDDELALSEKTPLKSLMSQPQKPPASAIKSLELAPPPKPEENTVLHAPELAPSLLLGTPARRMPQSPWKESMKSPARRVEGLATGPQSVSQPTDQPTQLQLKTSLLQSPAKRPQSPIKGLDFRSATAPDSTLRPFKSSLFSSPAKRPISPIKFPSRTDDDVDELARSPAPRPALLSTPSPAKLIQTQRANAQFGEFDQLGAADEEGVILDSPTRLQFSGRLSAVLPRYADPALKAETIPVPDMVEENETESVQEEIPETEETCVDGGDPMILDELEPEDVGPNSGSTTQPTSPKHNGPMFGLRQNDQDHYDGDSESDDELAPQQDTVRNLFAGAPITPSLAGFTRTADQAGTAGRSTTKRVRMDAKFGFTPLAQQLSSWNARPSTLMTGIHAPLPGPDILSATVDSVQFDEEIVRQAAATPGQSTFFEDEMLTRDEVVEAENEADELTVETPVALQVEEPEFDDIPVTAEDVALAAEAHEMSLMETDQVEDLLNENQSPDDSLSEASQEYGDENEIPVDPNLLGAEEPGVPPVTPQRVTRREFHTVSKVPLKAADDYTPRPKTKKRSHSISRLPVQRPSQAFTRNATVISYSPMKRREESVTDDHQEEERAQSVPPVTPSKTEAAWSTAVTPARTPRRDLNPTLLRGAVVHVDVHTSEGADASGIFVELLGQMGARCVKHWTWNPTSATESDKIGITHVVYKDGGVRTLEKVRETNGVVQCVGVSWVLDCERENHWLDEAPYYIDTTMVPRGGARRRKSMEPKALANLNGMLVPTPMRIGNGNGNAAGAQRECQTAPTTPAAGSHNRRASGLWMHTPENESEDGDSSFHHSAEDEDEDEGPEWGASFLTPVPKTPAPEAIARFAQNISPDPDTPIESELEEAELREALLMRTCPPKQSVFQELGDGVLGKEKDERVLLRLMAARRKSLQFAPKVGSPLARAWN